MVPPDSDRPSSDLLEALLHAVPLGILLIAPGGSVVFRNRHASEILTREVSPCDAIALRLVDGRAEPIELEIELDSSSAVAERLREIREKCSAALGSDEHAVILCREELPPDPDDLLFDDWNLTRTEARVAALVVRGHSVDSVARELGIASATARTHLRNIFSKTGTNRQADLIRAVITRTRALHRLFD